MTTPTIQAAENTLAAARARRDAVANALRPDPKKQALASAMLDGVEISSADLHAARVAQSAAQRALLKAKGYKNENLALVLSTSQHT